MAVRSLVRPVLAFASAARILHRTCCALRVEPPGAMRLAGAGWGLTGMGKKLARRATGLGPAVGDSPSGMSPWPDGQRPLDHITLLAG